MKEFKLFLIEHPLRWFSILEEVLNLRGTI